MYNYIIHKHAIKIVYGFNITVYHEVAILIINETFTPIEGILKDTYKLQLFRDTT